MLDKMKQLWELKKKMDEVKKELDGLQLASEDNLVKVTITGSQEVKSVEIKCDLATADKRKLESALADTVNRAVIKVTLDVPRVDSPRNRPPVNVALVLDRSGSMGGDKIADYRDGTETFDVPVDFAQLAPGAELTLAIRRAGGVVETVPVLCRIDTAEELSYYRHGGLLPCVYRELLAQAVTTAA